MKLKKKIIMSWLCHSHKQSSRVPSRQLPSFDQPEATLLMFQSSVKISRSKRRRLRKTAEKDIFSTLPDEVLCYLISFLPIKHAVRTSILSKRWRYLWTSAFLKLDFDDTVVDNVQWFTDLVDRALIQNVIPCLQRFLLKLNLWCDPHRVSKWIHAAIKRNIEDLDVCIAIVDTIVLPHCLFNCQKMVCLKLCVEIVLNIPEVVRFPSLKVLHLKSLRLDDADVEKLLFGSPMLEELLIDRPRFDHWQVLYVHSLSLKRLIISGLDLHRQMSCDQVVLDTPKLELLQLANQMPLCSRAKFSSLMEATIKVDKLFSLHERGHFGDQVVKLLRKTSEVKFLRLCKCMVSTIFDASDSNLPTFDNLTHLEIDVEGFGWVVFRKILECLPNMEILMLNKVEQHNALFRGRCYNWNPPKFVPLCFSACLEVMEFRGFEGCIFEMEIVEYFLKYAMVLKKMKISWCTAPLEEESDIVKKVFMFRRVSNFCEVEFTRNISQGT